MKQDCSAFLICEILRSDSTLTENYEKRNKKRLALTNEQQRGFQLLSISKSYSVSIPIFYICTSVLFFSISFADLELCWDTSINIKQDSVYRKTITFYNYEIFLNMKTTFDNSTTGESRFLGIYT